MDKFYTMEIAGLKRDLPICPLNEKLSIAGFIMFRLIISPTYPNCVAISFLRSQANTL